MIFPLETPIALNSINQILEPKDTLFGNNPSIVTHIGFPETKVNEKVICFAKDETILRGVLEKIVRGAIIFTDAKNFEKHKSDILSKCCCITSSNPRNSFAYVIDRLVKKTDPPFILEQDRSKIHEKSYHIGPSTVLTDCVKIGKKVVIGPNCSIGNVGFGFYIDKDSTKKRFPHYGGVIIENNVEIDANVSIDRGVFTNTILGENTKVGSLVHIAHNAKIGKNVIIAPHSKVCGSVIIGNNSYISPGTVVRQSVKIGEGSIIGMGSIVTNDIPPFTLAYGTPARTIKTLDKTNELPV